MPPDDPKPQTPEEWWALIAAQREIIEKYRQQTDLLLKTLEKQALPSRVHSGTTIDTMSSALDTESMPGPKFTSKHPLPAKAKAQGLSIPKVAELVSKALKRKIPRTTLRSWYADNDGRPIPEDAVKFFAAQPWSIPRSAWKNGISDTSA